MKLITKDSDYAIAALVELVRADGRSLSASELSDRLSIAHPFLRRIMQALAGAGIVQSRRGSGGGFTLARDPGAITVREVVELFQGPIRVGGCDHHCARRASCVLRCKLAALESRLVSDLMAITLASLANGVSSR